MRLSAFFMLLVAASMAWGLISAPAHAVGHDAHAVMAAMDQQSAPGHADHEGPIDCCAIKGGVHCVGAAGVLPDPSSVRVAAASAISSWRFESESLSARNPDPPAKPPRF